jgi:hypothetical protein
MKPLLEYVILTLQLNANILRDSILIRLETLQFQAYVHVCAVMWRQLYRELRALTNDNGLELNPLDLNTLCDDLWEIGTLLRGNEAMHIFDSHFRPWPKVRIEEVFSQKFYTIHERHREVELEELRAYRTRPDIDLYKNVLCDVLRLFG